MERLTVGQKAVTLRKQIPGAQSYEVLVQNRGETAWRDTLGLKQPADKMHHLRNVKGFHNKSAYE